MTGNKIINLSRKIESDNKNIPSVFHLCKSIRLGCDSLKGKRGKKELLQGKISDSNRVAGRRSLKMFKLNTVRETIGQIVSLSFSREVEIRRWRRRRRSKIEKHRTSLAMPRWNCIKLVYFHLQLVINTKAW